MKQNKDILLPENDGRLPYYREIGRRAALSFHNAGGDTHIFFGVSTASQEGIKCQLTSLYYAVLTHKGGDEREADHFTGHEWGHGFPEEPGAEGCFSVFRRDDGFGAGYWPTGRRKIEKFIELLEGPGKKEMSGDDRALQKYCDRLVKEGRGSEEFTEGELRRMAKQEGSRVDLV